MPVLSLEYLESLYAKYHRLELLYPDPLVYARGYDAVEDGEIAGLFASAFAYGRVEHIMHCLSGLFLRLGDCPSKTIKDMSVSDIKDFSSGFKYRFQKEQDLALFVWMLRQALDRWGSLSRLFQHGDNGGELCGALCHFVQALRSGDPRPILKTRRIPDRHPALHLLASPGGGGASKRLCLFLRWMVRRDELDPGYWNGRVDPCRLVIPLDTHVARISRYVGLTRRATPDWKMACEISAALRQFDPTDPIRFDFSLFRFGMTGEAEGGKARRGR